MADLFVVKHYIGDKRPSIKGNGFDGLEIGQDQEEAERFVAFVNGLIDAQHLTTQTVECLRYERDNARAQVVSAAKLLISIHALLYPAPVTLADGRTMVFKPKDLDPHEVLQQLSDRIRALPDQVRALN